MVTESPIATLRNRALIFKPNLSTLGYGLFLALNAASVWGGVFPFLPMEFQTPDIMSWFFLAQSLVFSASFFASAYGVYLFPGPTRNFLVKLAAVPYFLGWCCLIGAIYLDGFALQLIVVGGCLLGLGSAGFFMIWQRLFASQDSDAGNRDIILGTAFASVLYFALYLIPRAVTAYLIPLVFLPLFGLAIILKSRQIDLDQAMFQDIPREHPVVYRRIMADYWRSAFCVGALGFCTGVMRSLAIENPTVGALVNIMSMGVSLLAAILFLLLWQSKSLRLNIPATYRVFFPFIITSFVLLPFAPVAYEEWLAAFLYAAYSVTIMLMMMQCAQASRDRGANPVFIYGFFGGIVYALNALGFMSGTLSEQIKVMGMQPLAVAALVAVYLLGIIYFASQARFASLASREAKDPRFAAERIELTALQPQRAELREQPTARAAHAKSRAASQAAGQKQGTASEPSPRTRTPQSDEPTYQDRISKQAVLLQQAYRLSARETEVMELIARGNTVARIAEDLVVSENTIRTHAKRIYAKLDIHKKQELLDLVESFNPGDLEE